MSKDYSLKFYEGKHKVWETQDDDVTRLFSKNTPRNRINPSLDKTIETLNKKFN